MNWDMKLWVWSCGGGCLERCSNKHDKWMQKGWMWATGHPPCQLVFASIMTKWCLKLPILRNARSCVWWRSHFCAGLLISRMRMARARWAVMTVISSIQRQTVPNHAMITRQTGSTQNDSGCSNISRTTGCNPHQRSGSIANWQLPHPFHIP